MPEEINRVVTDHVGEWWFTPTDLATAELATEGITGDRVRQVGDVMYDVALAYEGSMRETADELLQRLGLTTGGYAVATVHRQDNTDDPNRLQAILEGLTTVSESMPVVWPIHPRTAQRLESFGLALDSPGIIVTEPLGFFDFGALVMQAGLVATDSGGVQKEAYFRRVPCVTLRDETEWVELVEGGWNVLVQPSTNDIGARILDRVGTKGSDINPYGDGNASALIAAALAEIAEGEAPRLVGSNAGGNTWRVAVARDLHRAR